MMPPRLVRWLVRCAARPDDRDAILLDLAEELDRRAATQGGPAARRWYRWQALRSIAPLVGSRFRRPRNGWAGSVGRPDVAWREGARWVARHPRLSAVCVGTVAVASGAALAAGTVVHRVLLTELPFPDAGRIVALWNVGPDLDPSVRTASFQDLQDWRLRAAFLEAVSGETTTSFTMTGQGDPRRVEAARVARDFDRVLGVRPRLGRLFEPGDFEAGAHYRVVLTHAFWQRDFAGSPDVVGRLLTLDDRPYEIVGVLPPMPTPVPVAAHELWVPLIARPGVFWENSRGTTWLNAVGRLRAGVSLDSARAELGGLAATLASEHPASNAKRVAMELRPLRDEIVGGSTRVLFLIGAAIGVVLLVAWANLTNLLLTHATRRRREFGIRRALGATRSGVVTQVGVECVLLTGTGVALGLIGSPALVDVFAALYPGALPRAGELRLSGTTMAAAGMLAAAGALLLAWPQARLLAGRRLPADVSRPAGATSPPGERRVKSALLAAQVAISVVLLTCGLAFAHTLRSLSRIDPGFDAGGVVTLGVTPSRGRFSNAGQTAAFFDELRESVRAIPGVSHVATGTAVPFLGGGWQFPLEPEPGADGEPPLVGVSVVSPDYFAALGMRFVAGRTFERVEPAPAVIVNDALGRLLSDDGQVVGRPMAYDGDRLIVGVVEGARRRLGSPAAPELYMPIDNAGMAPQWLIVNAGGDAMAVLPAIAGRLRALDPGAPISNVDRLGDVIDRSLAPQRFRAVLLSALSLVALAVAALGVYSVTAFVVSLQERETSIRRALGEPAGVSAGRILLSAMRPAVVGAAAGAAVAWTLRPALAPLLSGTDLRSPWLIGLVVLILLLITTVAAALPARRAASVDPARTLRAQ